MSRRQRVAIVFLCCVTVIALTLACATTKRYHIEVAGDLHWCDDYSWDGDDLHLFRCGGSNGDVVILNAFRAVITDNWLHKE